MDARTGKLYQASTKEKMEALLKEKFNKEEISKFLKPVLRDLTQKEMKEKKVGRNSPCPCGSGIKFKKCCLIK